MYGSFTAGSGTKIASTTGTSPNRLTHNTPKSFVGGKVSWTFNWVAPATGTGVRFYFAANASNFDNNESFGDAIYTSSQLGPIPVELMSFDGKMEGKNVKLTWKTASERNNRAFVIERNADNNADKFETIGEVKGSLTSSNINNYNYTDNAPLSNQVNYYRLRQVDIDGTSTFSKVISIGTKGNNKGFIIYPNFVSRGSNLSVKTIDNTSVMNFDIIDISGKVVQHIKNAPNTDGSQVATSDLPTGRYFVRSTDNLLPITSSFIVF
jgi:Secretion system C-terminal sorting domain